MWHEAMGEGKRSPLANSFPWYRQPRGQAMPTGEGWEGMVAVGQTHSCPSTFLVRTPTGEGQACRKGDTWVVPPLGLEEGGHGVRGAPGRARSQRGAGGSRWQGGEGAA